jgi:hypothetical protein
VPDELASRLIRVILGGVLVSISNVRVSGKGRRYRGSWENRQTTPYDAAKLFNARLLEAARDISKFASRPTNTFELVRGDARTDLPTEQQFDLSVFSPPYPNSFDYTDVYNVELWTLGYLTDMDANRRLRQKTLSSHVQINREFLKPPLGSPSLDLVLKALESERLWDKRIPAMLGGYFADMIQVLESVRLALKPNSQIWMVVGDSRYGGIEVPVARILSELAVSGNLSVLSSTESRTMRESPQQGGAKTLAESVVVLGRD